MTDDNNVFEMTAWERNLGSARGTRLGPHAGSHELGCSLLELDPGGQATPYHLHHGNEELLIVLAGELELPHPRGHRTVSRGRWSDSPAARPGPTGFATPPMPPPADVLVSTMRFPEVAEQLDTGTILAMSEPGTGLAFAAGSEGEYIQLTMNAIQADPGA